MNEDYSTNSKDKSSLLEFNKKNNHRLISTRIIFLKVGEIDTKNESFGADIYIECSWEDDEIYKSLAEKIFKAPNKNAKIDFKYNPKIHWSPELYIENGIELKEEVKYKIEFVEKAHSNDRFVSNGKKSPSNSILSDQITARVHEMKKIKGKFYEKLELYDFPIDLQEISIKLSSKKSSDEVELVDNHLESCDVCTSGFLDQQQWDLFEHVKVSHEILHDPWNNYVRSEYKVSAFAVRKIGFYIYNAFMLIFLVSVIGFAPFAFQPNTPQFRCTVNGLLVLTLINFRWVITAKIPSVSYLTQLDKYSIGCVIHLAILFVWHALIGSSVITTKFSVQKELDYYVLYSLAAVYALFNIYFIFWFVKMYMSVKNFRNENKKQAELKEMHKSGRKEELEIKKLNLKVLEDAKSKIDNDESYQDTLNYIDDLITNKKDKGNIVKVSSRNASATSNRDIFSNRDDVS